MILRLSSILNQSVTAWSPPPCTPLPVRVVRMKYHIVSDDNGNGGIPSSDIEALNENLEEAFSFAIANPQYQYTPAAFLVNRLYYTRSILFEVSSINYIDNSVYYNVTQHSNELNALYQEDNDPTMLNVYIVNRINTDGGELIDGIANGYGTNASVLSSEGGIHLLYNTLAHEIGHNFGLYHVFEESGGLCLDHNLSSTTGDLISDTPVDNTAFTDASFDSNCNHTGHKETCVSSSSSGLVIPYPDWQAEFLAKNLMSYVKSCRTDFTLIQMAQIKYGGIINNYSYETAIPTCEEIICCD